MPKKKRPLNQEELWLKNLVRAGQRSTLLSPKKNVPMPMHECSKKTKIFSPASRGI